MLWHEKCDNIHLCGKWETALLVSGLKVGVVQGRCILQTARLVQSTGIHELAVGYSVSEVQTAKTYTQRAVSIPHAEEGIGRNKLTDFYPRKEGTSSQPPYT